MGTNYYAVRKRPTTDTPIHIGKSSFGWLFNFQIQNDTWNDPPVVWNTYEQVKEWLYRNTVENERYVIINEYDEVISYEEFIDLVESKQKDEQCLSNKDNYTYSRNVNGYRFTDEEFF